jgi:hypothetical protein
MRLTERGFVRHRLTGGYAWLGLQLRVAEDGDDGFGGLEGTNQ